MDSKLSSELLDNYDRASVNHLRTELVLDAFNAGIYNLAGLLPSMGSVADASTIPWPSRSSPS